MIPGSPNRQCVIGACALSHIVSIKCPLIILLVPPSLSYPLTFMQSISLSGKNDLLRMTNSVH